jgi:hypothetical protein
MFMMFCAVGIGGNVGQIDLGLVLEESSILAFSAASFKRCKASASCFKSMPVNLS